MNALDNVFMAVVGLAQEAQSLFFVSVGALPADESICTARAAGAPQTTCFDKGMPYQITMVLNGKSTDQQKISGALGEIHTALTQAKQYPSAEGWQITDIETVSAPAYLDREQNSQWLYGSSLRVKFYLRSDKQ